MKKLLKLRSIILLGIIGGTMLWIGLQKINSRENAPTVYETAFEIEKGGANWIKIEHCILNVMESSFKTDYTSAGTKEIIIPIVLDQNSSNLNYYLQTTDTSFVNPFDRLHQLHLTINASENKIVLGKDDPEYLNFQNTTIEKLNNDLNDLLKERENLIQNYPLIEITSQGFILTESEKFQLGYYEEDVIIKHNGGPASGFYTWFLLIIGSLLSLLCLLSFISFLLKASPDTK
jgi:hypothetical protein